MPRAAGAPGVVLLAAGEGKRFKSARPKVLHELAGVPMLVHVIRAAEALKPSALVLVVGRDADRVEEVARSAAKAPLAVALQAEQIGTADATRIGEEALGRGDGDVVVLPADIPLLTGATLRKLVSYHRRRRAAATVLTARLDDPRGYGRVVRDPGGMVARIVEDVDASDVERRIVEVNTSVWVFDRALLRAALAPIERANKQKEFYLTDVAAVLVSKGETVEAMTVDAEEVVGVNSRSELARAAAAMREAIAERHMSNGVTIVDPSQTFIDADVRIGRDTTILPLTFLSGGTVIGAGCEIGPSVRATGSTIKDGARVQFAVLDRATVGPRASVGPFAYLRPGARLDEGAKAGTYVEIKNSRIGKGSKVPHLSYIGDAELGEDVNIGAGTITCNYDGFEKHRTVVEDGARIGSDTMLVAPVRIGRGAFTGAGSAIAQDVPPGALGIERTTQRNVEGYAGRKRAKAASKAKRGRGASK